MIRHDYLCCISAHDGIFSISFTSFHSEEVYIAHYSTKPTDILGRLCFALLPVLFKDSIFAKYFLGYHVAVMLQDIIRSNSLLKYNLNKLIFPPSSFYYRKSVLLHGFGRTDKCYNIDDDFPLKQIGFLQ